MSRNNGDGRHTMIRRKDLMLEPKDLAYCRYCWHELDEEGKCDCKASMDAQRYDELANRGFTAGRRK